MGWPECLCEIAIPDGHQGFSIADVMNWQDKRVRGHPSLGAQKEDCHETP
ncbi:MAG TPA: hypothetical protein PKZ35_17180 [Gammaproteobacteria bacterium]|nr:hypothetical protein [Gammaproteobacteria bacterium]